MLQIDIRQMDITNADTEIIVNAANSSLLQGGGVCGAVFHAAGAKQLQRACDAIGYCKTGSAVITPGFDLCPYIIHVVGPIWNGGEEQEEELLFSAYQSALELAKKQTCHSIAFPLVSAGIYGYPLKEAWKTALSAVLDWEKNNSTYDMLVIFAVLDQKTKETGTSILHQLKEKKAQ